MTTTIKKKKKKKKGTRAERSAENKRKWAEKRKADALARKKAKAAKAAAEKPAIETPAVDTTPHPRAGDNKEFRDILDPERRGPLESEPGKPGAGESQEPEKPTLRIEDVAEWVKWPFELWSTSQSLPPIIEPAEALEIAEPLTRILNRHGVGEQIPPDVLDVMQIIGRTLPIVKRGNDMVKAERMRRAKVGQSTEAGKGRPAPQGAPSSKPVEL